MHRYKAKAVLLFLAGALALGLLALAWAVGAGSSEAQQGAMHNCPQPNKWAISVWDGADGTDTSEALATCGEGAVDFAYYIDPDTQGWLRYVAARTDISNLLTLSNMQGVLAHGGPPPSLTPTPTPELQEHAVAGATYTGTHSGGGSVEFTVAADGTTLPAFRITDIPGNSCSFDVEGEEGVWGATPINNNTFAYESATLLFSGHFLPAGRAEGTLRASFPQIHCESAMLTWTATAP